jgi:glc operon protein GlcG
MSNPQVALAYGPSILLADAQRIAEAARLHAQSRGWPMAIAVVDAAGHLLCLLRMDDTQLGSIAVAQQKAETAVRFRRPTRTFEAGLEASTLGIRALTMAGVSAIDGGVPLVREGRVVGGVGVSGMLPVQDAEVANIGAAALTPSA